MGASFDIALNRSLFIEGEFSDHREDIGGETVWGVSRVFHGDKFDSWPPSLDDVIVFYHNMWSGLRLDGIHSQDIANEVFDTAINQWPAQAAKWLQEAYNRLLRGREDRFPSMLKVDGVIGPKTLGAVNVFAAHSAEYERALFNLLNHWQGDFFLDRSKDVFIVGLFAKRIGGWQNWQKTETGEPS